MTLPRFELDLDVPALTTDPLWMIGPRSLFADRISPDLEFIVVPPRQAPALKGRWEADPAPRTTADYRSRKDKVLPWRAAQAAKATPKLPEGCYLLDIRDRDLANWSHALNQGLVLALKARDLCREHGAPDPVIVVTTTCFSKVVGFFEKLGFGVLRTDEAVTAPLITYTEDRRTVLRYFNRAWAEPHLGTLADAIAGHDPGVGRSIFISRRDGRAIANIDVIQPMLEARGFDTVYPEEHSLEVQFQMIHRAERIVAIHGAGLAPLLFRRDEQGPLQFVEIFSASHITPFFKELSSHVNCDYRAVRGVPDPATLPAAYDPETSPREFAKSHSLRPFQVDPVSLEVALGADPFGELKAGKRPQGLA